MIYLDNSATTRVLPEAARLAADAMTELYYNPAGAYGAAVKTEKRVEEARRTIASVIGASPNELIFTSGGTESNNAAILGTLRKFRGKLRIITTQTEHPSVYELFRFLERDLDLEVMYAPGNADGSVNLEALEALLTPNTALVSVMHVNNEVGTINRLDRVAALVHRLSPRAVFHSDGVQAYLKVNASKPFAADMYSISGHKFHAPKGVGALYIKNGTPFDGGQIGGGQERNLRSGTTNVPGVLAMACSANVYANNMAQWHGNMRAMKMRLYSNLISLPDVVLNGPPPDAAETSAPHILNLSFLGVRGEVLLHAVDGRGLCVATGSACSAHKKGKNRILNSMGITGIRQEGAIRFSLCPFNTAEEMDVASQIIAEQVAFLRRYKRR